MTDFPIFKVSKLSNKNIIEDIYVFYGENDNELDLDELFSSSPKNEIFETIFDDDELTYIKNNNTNVIFINQSIHIDDNIGTLKLKLFEALNKQHSIDEMYLFCLKNDRLNPVSIYQQLTHNDKLVIKKSMLDQLLFNLYEDDGELMDVNISEKQQYSFDDILSLNLTDKSYLVSFPLGQNSFFDDEYPYIANPFLVNKYDSLMEKTRRETQSLNGNLVLESRSVFRNTFYLCLTEDVFNYFNSKKIDTKFASKNYYPILYKEQIEDINKLKTLKPSLLKQTSDKITTDTERSFNNIDLFYNIYNNANSTSDKFSQNMRLSGVKNIKIAIYPEFKINIPIDTIFKLIHATKDLPLIKYNPEHRQENIYRLYAPNLTIDGRKIPYLSKPSVFKLMKTIGRHKSVSIYINLPYNETNLNIVCEIDEGGVMTIYPVDDFSNPILTNEGPNMFSTIDDIIKSTINPIIEEIKPFFEQSGVELRLFETILSNNVEIIDLKFQSTYNITNTIDLNNLIGCLSSVFTIESADIKKNAIMRYKRVSNYNKRDSQEAFVIQKIEQGFSTDEIVQGLVEQFNDLDETLATELIGKLARDLENLSTSKRRKLLLKINPGFLTVMNINAITSELYVIVSGINNIMYLKTLPVYIDSIVRITQDIDSCGVDKSDINKLCTGEEINDVEFQETDDLSRPVSETTPSKSSKMPSIRSTVSSKGEFDFGEIDDTDIFDALGLEDFEEDEIHGGAENDSSRSLNSDELSSIPSHFDFEDFESESEPKIKPSPNKPLLTLKKTKPVKKINALSKSSSESVSEDSVSEESVKEKLPKSSSVSEDSISEESVSEESAKAKLPTTPSESVSEESVSEESVKPKLPKSSSVSEESVSEESVKAKLPTTPSESVSEESVFEVPIQQPKLTSNIVKEVFKDNTKTETKVKTKINATKKIEKEIAKGENKVKDITGMSLNNPNPFTTRLNLRIPQLFEKSKNPNYDAYSRICPNTISTRRQPVILTSEEKEQMMKEHPELNTESEFIEYNADPKDETKKYYYTCPRYWCLLTDKMVTEQDILNGKCGPKVGKVEDAVIPKYSKKVPSGKYVYQFYDENEKMYPGFHTKKTTESGLCMPCCFAKWNTPAIKNRRDICQGQNKKEDAQKVDSAEELIEEKIRKEMPEMEAYVKGPDKYGPGLPEHRWGFLPVPIQKFLHEVNDDCQVSKTNTSLKLNHTCILRHGVETSDTQSFIACIASAIFYGEFDGNTPLLKKILPDSKYEVPSIKDMRQIIIDSINLDMFIKYQNGDLITSFSNPDLNVSLNEYKDTQLYEKMLSESDKNKRSQIAQFILKVAQSFENFKLFLSDNKETIDYTYLWDLVCMPNPMLFKEGINLIILEIPENDVTNNVELICPTNHYSANAYDVRKRSLILVKRENYFEPIYGYKNDGKTIHVTKTFSEHDKKLPQTLRSVFAKIIKPTLGEKCRAFASRPNVYKFKQPPLLNAVIDELKHRKFKIKNQVLNFQGKVVGVIAINKKGKKGFVPCYPSSLTNMFDKKCVKSAKSKKDMSIDELEENEDDDEESQASGKETTIHSCSYDFVYMNDDIWSSYEDTLAFLKDYYNYEEPDDITKVNCFNPKYFCRIAENELITGFLTNTDIYIPIRVPVPVSSVDDSIKTITNDDTLVADINTLNNDSIDNKRVDFVKRIQLETNFYNVFRNTIRILFNDYSNGNKRTLIKEECNKRYALYNQQLKKVIEMLKDLVDDAILFAENDNMGYNYANINDKELHTCLTKTKNKCVNNKGTSICRMTNDTCQLVLPKLNLVNNTNNEEFYYGRMADELIRYNRIKSYIFQPKAYLSFSQIKYNLRDDEIIVLQDLLNAEFFDNLNAIKSNKYAKHNTYDTANPIVSQAYNNNVEMDEVINPYHERDCNKSEPQKIKSIAWRKCFPKTYREVEYTNSNYCSLYMIIDLVKSFNNKNITLETVKDVLIHEYRNLTSNFTNIKRVNCIIDLLREEAQFDANQLQDKTMRFEQMILNEGFVAVNFDLWILLKHFKIPSIFISSKLIPETRYNAHEFVCYTNSKSKHFALIVAPAMYRRKLNKLPEYKLIVDEKNDVSIDLNALNNDQCLTDLQRAIENYIDDIGEFLDKHYEKDNKTKYKPRQKGERDAVQFVIENKEEPEELKEELKKESEEEIVIQPKKKKLKMVKQINETIRLDDEEKEEIIIVPKKKRKTKKQVKVNPQGKRQTKKNIQFIIESDSNDRNKPN